MDSNALKAFITIVDQGSFSEAAELLHLSQPAISKRLAALENQLGETLIDRSQRQIRLTDSGSRLLPHARKILDEIHNARIALSPNSGVLEGELHIIASHHIGLHHLPKWLRRFKREHPQVTINLQFMESDAAYEQMRKRNAELAFVTLSDSMPASFHVFAQWPDPMAFVVGTDHPLAAIKTPKLADLAQHPALLPDTSTSTYRVVSRLFLEANLPLHPQMPTNYLETLKMMTSVGLGWSVLPLRMADESLKVLEGVLAKGTETGNSVTRALGGIGLTGRQPGNAAKAMLRIVQEEEGNPSKS
ncbi:LysR family transcriptional regulator [Marinobacter salexigens]|uniref:LysR family transcriptional regulator n=1 Tax=Marinobacter salexigens TaxID=1925763 RepID=A0ABS6ACD8_9GAMM|nr:LysR family transcriptional regulator [Marinobacter salexigens]